MKTRPPSKGPTIPPERPAASKTPPPRVSVDGKRWHEQQASSPAPTLVSQIAEGFARAAIGAIGSLSLTDVTARIGAKLRGECPVCAAEKGDPNLLFGIGPRCAERFSELIKRAGQNITVADLVAEAKRQQQEGK